MFSIASKALATVNSYLSPAKPTNMAENMDLYDTRLATFQSTQTTGRKRASTAKGGKSGKWNLKSPSAEQLAQAGFYYAPTGTGSDNVTCFCCNKSLDGWEEGDNAFSEHFHFSSDCAWAVLMAIENDADETLKTEDPMSDRMIEARRQTFRDQWPHEKKRGWTCKIQKMVEAGWYFSPSPEGDDQANCVYCKKSLWGWEPKDKPYDEHQKRSPDCIFFSLSMPKPSTKGRKGRVSKASRISNQSVVTVNIDDSNDPAVNLDDTEASTIAVDVSTLSTTSKAKKGSKGKKGAAKNARSKKAPPVTEAQDIITDEVSIAPVKATRGKKRTSDQMLADTAQVMDSTSAAIDGKFIDESLEIIEPPKKRATRTRNSTAKAASREPSLMITEVTMEDSEPPMVTSKKGVKGGRKRASSTMRKASRTVSAQSIAMQTANALRDDEIDAALQADLERFESDDESDNWKVLGKDDSVVSQIYNPQTRTSAIRMSTLKTKGKSNASLIEQHTGDVLSEDHSVTKEGSEPTSSVVAVKKAKGKPGRKAKKTVSVDLPPELESTQPPNTDIKDFEASLEAEDQDQFESVAEHMNIPEVVEMHVPEVVEQDIANRSRTTAADDSGHETDGSILAQKKDKRSSKKGKGATKPKQSTRKASSKQKNIKKQSEVVQHAFVIPAEVRDDDVAEEFKSLENEYQDVALGLTEAPTPRKATGLQEQMISPEASIQGSDAENQPPSSRPSQSRPPLARYSPTGARTVRIALAPSTPTAVSKHNARLETTYPWAPADIEYILTGTPAVNRENFDTKTLLNSTEKGMSVEEWINFNARKNEDRLKAECERMVGKFENEGVRALKTLEGIVCSD